MTRLIKSASLLVAAVMLAACSGQEGGTDTPGPVVGGTLKLTSDKNLIQTFDGDYAVLTVTLDGEPVTEGVTFFDGKNKNKVISLPDFKFSTETVGEYEIWANYGTLNSDPVSIKAIDIAIPDTPEDPEPQSTDFVSRILLTEFTTVGCSACPAMKTILHELADDKELGPSVVFTECHSGLVNSVADPCYLYDIAFEEFCMVGSFPTVKFGLDETLISKDAIKSVVREELDDLKEVAPGIAVNSNMQDSKIVAKVTVKARSAASYRVGAFLLEDGIEATQVNASADWMHIHDNVIRYVDASYKSSFYGYPLAELQSGETADIMFSWILDEIWEYGSGKGEINGGIAWPERNDENLHMVIFVSMSDGNGGYFVSNAIDVRNLNGQTKFEYR